MKEKQVETVKRKPAPARCMLDGEKYELIHVINGTARIRNDSGEYFVLASLIKPTNKAARDMVANG